MPAIRFTNALKRFFPSLQEYVATGSSLHEVFNEIEIQYPGVKNYLLDERGRLRKHVNIFIDGTIITDRDMLSDAFAANSEIYIIQALSGG